MKETIHCRGHEHVRATHTSTLEVTTDDWLTPAGDCILGIEADRSPADFSPEFISACQDAEATITALLQTANHDAAVVGRGHPDLTFKSERGAVLRTSTYVDERTVMVEADAAAADIDRELIETLTDGEALTTTLVVE